MSSNKFQVYYKSTEGIELDTWLRQNGEMLKNKRIFYVVRAKLDKERDVYKIGISERGSNSAFGRLADYVHFYGVSEKENNCKGVKLYLLLGNVFNADVAASKAAVRRLETKVIADFADKRERGRERIHVTIQELFKYLEDNNYLNEDIETATRQTPRLAEKQQGANDAVKKIISHTTNRRGDTLFDVEFLSGLKYDVNQVAKSFTPPNRLLKYEDIIQLRHGKRLVDEYIKNNNIVINPTNPELQRPVTRSRGNFNVTTLPTAPQTTQPPPVPRVTRSRARNANFTETTL